MMLQEGDWITFQGVPKWYWRLWYWLVGKPKPRTFVVTWSGDVDCRISPDE